MVTQIEISNLDSWLQSQPENTGKTSYELEITGLTVSNWDGIITSLRNNSTKYVDLRPTVLPEGITDLHTTSLWGFQYCTSLAYAPVLPSTLQYMIDAFAYTSLIEPPVIPDNVIRAEGAFQNCTELCHKPIFPVDCQIDSSTYEGVECDAWSGTLNQVAGWLPLQEENDTDTPYRIKIEGLTSNNYNNLYTILYNNSAKYVDLRENVLPNPNQNSYDSLFRGCTSLVYPPQFPNTATRMSRTFEDCTSLKETPVFPDSVNFMYRTFFGCTSLEKSYILPNNANMYMAGTFYNCESLTYKPVLPPSCQESAVYEGVITDIWCGTEYQIRRWIPSRNEEFTAVVLDANAVPTDKKAFGVNFSDLPDLLAELPDNPFSPYIIKVLGLTAGDIGSTSTPGTLGYVLYRNAKYVDLSATVIPSGVTDMSNAFFRCRLAEAPVIPDGVTNMRETFKGCPLVHKPIIPDSVTDSTSCYDLVTALSWKGTQSQADSFLSTFFSQTEDCEILVYEDDRETYKTTVGNIDITTLSDYLAVLDPNTVSTAYKVYIRGLTSSNASDIKAALFDNETKFVDLRYTQLPNGTECRELFSDYRLVKGCETLVYAPVLPSDTDFLLRTFENCFNLQEAPVIPNGVTIMAEAFCGCTSLVNAPVIPNGVTDMSSTFAHTSLVNAPVIPDGVTDMLAAFQRCDSLVNVPVIPNSVTRMNYAFFGCTSLRKIDRFEVPLSRLKNNSNFQGVFEDCTSLEQIGFKPEQSTDWHVFRLKFGSNNISGKIYDPQGNSVNIPTTSITKSTLQLPILTDELLFSNSISDADLDTLIQKVISYKYGYFNKDVLNPENKSFVLWADNPDRVITNLKFPADLAHSSGVLPVTSGGTGQTTQLAANKAIIAGLTESTSDVTDGTMFVSSYASNNGFADTSDGGPNKPYKRKFSAVWNYIKNKISSVLGLTATSYGGNAATANASQALTKAVTCSTAGGTAAKTVTLAGFTLVKGARLIVTLSNANTAASALTLNVNGNN